ncbi:MAG: cysteine--tRNA ligase [Alphaproteobacteria bacterium]|nr:cysteine--tRNA ligase [Alphaproteobacteria bacterium]
MALQLYNSLTHRKEAFAPLDPTNVRMYVCGPTVYDLAHIGNARAVVVFDQLYRVLRHEYGAEHVTYVRNITDVEDKIIEAAFAHDETIEALTARTTAEFHLDMAALNTLRPNFEPRATGFIHEMVAMIERLIGSGNAYAAQGHVLFAVASYPEYGRLSRRSRDEMVAGARVEIAPYKRDPGDFVLWKPSTPEQPGWDSPWGRGRPGWHIECSAMSAAHLGQTFDIHGGGIDLVFPHHENEIAQSVCAHDGREFVRFWVHNGFLTVDGAKMAKSLGNFVTVQDLLGRGIPGEVIRLALLTTHYRDPLDWTEEKLRQSQSTLDRFYRALTGDHERRIEDDVLPEGVLEALEDDVNTPLAIARLHDVAGHAYRASNAVERGRWQMRLVAGGQLLGLLGQDPLVWLHGEARQLGPDLPDIIEARAQARRERRFAEADRIRAELAARGIVLEDKPDGTTVWRKS